MERTCQLMDNGDLYEILQDGTIHKIGNMSSSNSQTNNNRSAAIVVLVILWIITIVISIACYNDVSRSKSYYYSQYSEYYDKYGSTNSELGSLKSELSKIDTPIVISKIEVKNEGENYNQRISSTNTTYIYPKIYYFSTKSQLSITLKFKFFRNDGSLSRGSGNDYHSDYSFSNTFSTTQNKFGVFECSGWGGKDKGHWTPGSYRYEVWYGDRCLGVKHFTVY